MSRMEKYTSTSVKSRTSKNEKLYEDTIDSINYDYIDVNNAVELDPTDNTSSRENYQKQRELNNILNRPQREVKHESVSVVPKEDRIYDINELLSQARSEVNEDVNPNEKQSKRLINTEYNILTKLDLKKLDKDNLKKEDLKSLINDIYEKEEPKKMKNVARKSDDDLLKDLLEDNDNGSDLIDDLDLKEELAKDILEKNQDDLGTVPITEEMKDLKNEVDNKEIPESYHKEENEEEMFIFDDLKEKKAKKEKKKKKDRDIEITEIAKEEASREDGIDYDNIEKEGKGLLIAIIIVVVLIILTVLFFLYEYFFKI